MTSARRSRVPKFAVPRPRLTARLDAVVGGEVCAVVAPAGSGKSVLMSQWAEAREDLAIAWVDLTSASADPIVLARQLVEALDDAAPGALEVSQVLFGEGGGLPGEGFVTSILSDLGELDRQLVLVLDDVEQLGASDFPTETFERLLEGLPETVRVFVVARWDPPITFHRLRLDGRLHEVRSSELAFDVAETAALIRALTGIELDGVAARTLQRRTEGWAAGIRMAAASIVSSPDPSRFIDRFVGTDAHVAEYLVEEVLNELDTDVRHFLTYTSVLPWLSVELGAHVVETFDPRAVAAILELLEARELFLVRLGGDGDRVRYHHLFADLLRYELRRSDPSAEPGLLRRAADWFTANGHLTEAAEQFVELGDTERLLQLVREHGRRYYERNETATLVRWLTAVRGSAADVPAEVEIHLLAAQFACHQIAGALETSWALRRRDDLTPGERAMAEGLRALLGLHDLSPAETEHAASNALEIVRTLRPGDCYHVLGVGAEGMIEVFAWFMRGQAAFYDGDVDRAIAMLECALETSESDYVAWRVYVLGALALVKAWSGHLAESDALAGAATALAGECLTPQYVGLAYSRQAAALVALNQLDTRAARSRLDEAQPIIERSARPPLIGMQQLLRVGIIAVDEGAMPALEVIEQTAPPPLQPAVIARAWNSLHARLLIAVGRASTARDVVGSIAAKDSMPTARVDLALAEGNLATARTELDAWDVSPSDLDSLVGHRVRDAAIEWRGGSRSSALRALEAALSLAATEGLKRPLLEAPAALALLKSEPRLRTAPLAEEVLAAADSVYRRQDGQGDLVEPLTERELEILALLPSRQSNLELASELYISVNTLKTHLRHIYIKLQAEDRDEAISRAAVLGLL